MTLANSLMFDIMAKDLYLDQLHHVFDESIHFWSFQGSCFTLTSTRTFSYEEALKLNLRLEHEHFLNHTHEPTTS